MVNQLKISAILVLLRIVMLNLTFLPNECKNLAILIKIQQ